MPLLEKNISENEALFRHSSTRPQAAVLDWDEAFVPDEVMGDYDLIVFVNLSCELTMHRS